MSTVTSPPATRLRHLVRRALRVSVGVCVAACVACGPGKEQIKQERFEKGKAYAAQKKWPEAIVEFNAAIQQDAKFGEAHYAVARAYDQSNQPLKALGAYVRAADALPDNVDAQLKAATFLMVAQQHQDAEERARRVLEKDPKNVAARIIIGNALAGLKQFDDAIRELHDAIQLEPNQGELYTQLGVVQLSNARREEAEATFKQAIQIDPKSAEAHLALANFYWSQNRMSDAEAEIRQTLALQPNHFVANRALSELLIRQRRPRDAEQPMRALAATSKDPTDRLALAALYMDMGRGKEARELLERISSEPGGAVVAAPRLAGLEFSQGHRDRAYKILDDVLAKDSKNTSVLLAKGRLLSLEKKNDEAFAAVSAAAAANPEAAAAHYALGVLQQARHDLDGAYKSFSEVLRLNPRAVPAQLRLAELNLGRGTAVASLPFAEAATKRTPRDAGARLSMARSLVSAGRVADADAAVRALLKDYPKAAQVYSLAGSIQTMKRDRKEARRSFERALELQPGYAEAIAGLLNLDLLEKRLPEARARVEAAIAKAPSVPTWLMAGVVYKAAGDLAASERAFKKAIELDPSNAQAYAALGQAYLAQRKLEEARREFEEVGRRDPRSVMAINMTGMILQLQGKTADAKKRYEAALQIDPQSTFAANNLAWLYAQDGEHLDTALQLAQTAKQKAPEDPQVNDTLAWIYVKKDLAASAVPLLKPIVERNPGDPSFRYHLGMAYVGTGDRSLARQHLEAALKLRADFAGADEARKVLAQFR